MTELTATGSPERKSSMLERTLVTALRAAAPTAYAKVSSLRADALAHLAAKGLPGRNQEAFRFSPIGELAEATVTLAGVGTAEPSGLQPARTSAIEVRNGGVVHVSALPRGVHVARLSEASEVQLGRLGALATLQDGWVAANTAGFNDVLFITVDDGVKVESPLEVLLVQSSTSGAQVVFPRILVRVGRGSHLSLVERHAGVGDATQVCCSVSEIDVGEGAELKHSRWVDLGPNAYTLAVTSVNVALGGTYHSWVGNQQGRYIRHDLQVYLSGSRASAILDGLYYGRAGQLVDHHVRVWHKSTEGQTKECYRGIIEDEGRGVFDGIIYVQKGAMKTDARQENRNLLLGPKAVVNTKPHLEIDADDVACSHGATVGQLDESQLFYLQSRGIERKLGQELLTWAFAKEIVDRCPDPALREQVTATLWGKSSLGLEAETQ